MNTTRYTFRLPTIRCAVMYQVSSRYGKIISSQLKGRQVHGVASTVENLLKDSAERCDLETRMGGWQSRIQPAFIREQVVPQSDGKEKGTGLRGLGILENICKKPTTTIPTCNVPNKDVVRPERRFITPKGQVGTYDPTRFRNSWTQTDPVPQEPSAPSTSAGGLTVCTECTKRKDGKEIEQKNMRKTRDFNQEERDLQSKFGKFTGLNRADGPELGTRASKPSRTRVLDSEDESSTRQGQTRLGAKRRRDLNGENELEGHKRASKRNAFITGNEALSVLGPSTSNLADAEHSEESDGQMQLSKTSSRRFVSPLIDKAEKGGKARKGKKAEKQVDGPLKNIEAHMIDLIKNEMLGDVSNVTWYAAVDLLPRIVFPLLTYTPGRTLLAFSWRRRPSRRQ
ncbi:uncharacterized protein EV422DRAFT_536015 [Fimicolochytrium jonesii]|uniref:uncharacterized protein n=1 Tax=Fimicolochytrium jonesii TaxID=1396493 RepID=UPI0022FE9FE6|nr:uncharacterized protein EV422DRAFT_536015 [Fimicolochytrium jonesii]KAI8818949.1 hypothetical protein EV422DRAFT_536015 [Fimicolochytrium jonesii]